MVLRRNPVLCNFQQFLELLTLLMLNGWCLLSGLEIQSCCRVNPTQTTLSVTTRNVTTRNVTTLSTMLHLPASQTASRSTFPMMRKWSWKNTRKHFGSRRTKSYVTTRCCLSSCVVFIKCLDKLSGLLCRMCSSGFDSLPRSLMVDPLSYFSFQPVHNEWYNKGHGMRYHICGRMHVKETLLLIERSSPCSGGSSGFPLSLSDSSEWSVTICPTPFNHK